MNPSFLDPLREKKKLPPDVPEGYFEQCPDRMMHRLLASPPPMATAPTKRALATALLPYALAATMAGAAAWFFWPRTEPTPAPPDPLAQLRQMPAEEVDAYVEENLYDYAHTTGSYVPPPDTNEIQTVGPMPTLAELKRINVLAELDRMDPADLEGWLDDNPQELDVPLDDE